MKIKVAIVDDHPMVVLGLATALSAYDFIEITDTYPNGLNLMEGLQAQQPDVLLLDIQMPELTGSELAPMLLERFPELKIITLTNFDNGLYAHNMIAAGVLGYLLKTTEEETLIDAIRTVYEGKSFIEPAMREKMALLQGKTNRTFTTKSNLTNREMEILQLIVDGLTDNEIAKKIHLSLPTIKHYRISLLLKLDAKNAPALVKKAMQLGLVKF
jgi:DNA-binding NarL/FixJ family response regulator